MRRSVLSGAASGLRQTRITVQLPLEPKVPIWGWIVRRQWVFELEALPQTQVSPTPHSLS